MNDLKISKNSVAIQAFPLSEGNVNKISGVYTTATGVHCVDAGTIEITWYNGDIDTLTCVAGDDYMLMDHDQIELVTGTFHIM